MITLAVSGTTLGILVPIIEMVSISGSKTLPLKPPDLLRWLALIGSDQVSESMCLQESFKLGVQIVSVKVGAPG